FAVVFGAWPDIARRDPTPNPGRLKRSHNLQREFGVTRAVTDEDGRVAHCGGMKPYVDLKLNHAITLIHSTADRALPGCDSRSAIQICLPALYDLLRFPALPVDQRQVARVDDRLEPRPAHDRHADDAGIFRIGIWLSNLAESSARRRNSSTGYTRRSP